MIAIPQIVEAMVLLLLIQISKKFSPQSMIGSSKNEIKEIWPVRLHHL
jgi:hypothetical protein